jgi:hypothetical protein
MLFTTPPHPHLQKRQQKPFTKNHSRWERNRNVSGLQPQLEHVEAPSKAGFELNFPGVVSNEAYPIFHFFPTGGITPRARSGVLTNEKGNTFIAPVKQGIRFAFTGTTVNATPQNATGNGDCGHNLNQLFLV